MISELITQVKRFLKSQLVYDMNVAIDMYNSLAPKDRKLVDNKTNIREVLTRKANHLILPNPIEFPTGGQLLGSVIVGIGTGIISQKIATMLRTTPISDVDHVSSRINAVEYQCVEFTEKGLCKRDKTTGYEHRFVSNEPRVEITPDQIFILGRVAVLSRGITDYTGRSNSYDRPPLPDRYYVLGKLLALETDDGRITIPGAYLATDDRGDYLYIIGRVVHVHNQYELDSIIQHTGYSIVQYGESTCPHCEKTEKMLENVANEFPFIQYAYVECNKFNSLCDSKNISEIPILEIYKNGSLITTIKGETTRDKLFTYF